MRRRVGCLLFIASAVAYSPSVGGDPPPTNPVETAVKTARVKLAEMSLADARWRREAEKATKKIRPLGDSEAVQTVREFQKVLSAILDEEEFRAEQIVNRKGEAVRPKEAPPGARGPLGELEEQLERLFFKGDWSVVLNFFGRIQDEIAMIIASEKVRADRIRRAGFTQQKVRPKDAPPSALGRLEGFVDALFKEEFNRPAGQRPIDARVKGPLAKAEQAAFDLLETVNDYERRRLDVLLQAGILRRPMEQDQTTPLGILESLVVGVVRAPLLVSALVASVQDALAQEQEQQQSFNGIIYTPQHQRDLLLDDGDWLPLITDKPPPDDSLDHYWWDQAYYDDDDLDDPRFDHSSHHH